MSEHREWYLAKVKEFEAKAEKKTSDQKLRLTYLELARTYRTLANYRPEPKTHPERG